MNIYEQISEIADICEAIINEATLATPEIRDKVNKFNEIAQKSQEENKPKKTKTEVAKEAIERMLNSIRARKGKEAINCSYLSEGRHLKEIDKKIYNKMKYHSYGPEFKERVSRNVKNLKRYKAQLKNAQASGDTGAENVMQGQIKRTQNIAKRLSKEERAKMFKNLGKQIQAQIARNPAKMKNNKKK